MAFLQRAGATSFSFLRVFRDSQQTLWSTAQWPRKKTGMHCLLAIRTFRAMHIMHRTPSPSIWACTTEHVYARTNEKKLIYIYIFFFNSSLCTQQDIETSLNYYSYFPFF